MNVIYKSSSYSWWLKDLCVAKCIILITKATEVMTIIFLINISEFEYIENFSYIVSSRCEAPQI